MCVCVCAVCVCAVRVCVCQHIHEVDTLHWVDLVPLHGRTRPISISQMDFFNVLWGAMCNYQNNLDQVLHSNPTTNPTCNFSGFSDFMCMMTNLHVGTFFQFSIL